MNQASDEFKSQVLFILAHLPAGEVISYGELARQAGQPKQSRLVGHILKRLPAEHTLPWHRVVNSKRAISFLEGSDGYQRQRALLENEGWVIVGQRLITKEAL
ncbi:MGMT family protein [Marinomonas ostreistagni]|uniref:MGMT family protein n=1 Tax=Marinomonas ostreistagni TaxID=359209 RepID=UPI00194F6E2E|nr:methylated-DNA--[protein]-cysteine S-methyltransferase [Marinomonas ostreistagni]MBM6550110.1 methylated-DNA--[protein]-cysteine S-methyltransferase [Marinomonas ostreistagni]